MSAAETRSAECDLPLDVGITWIKRQVESALAVRIYANVHHQRFVGDRGAACQMEKHGHVVPVIRRIEARDIDQAAAQTVSKVAGVQSRPPIVCEVDRLIVRSRVCNPSRAVGTSSEGGAKASQEGYQRQ